MLGQRRRRWANINTTLSRHMSGKRPRLCTSVQNQNAVFAYFISIALQSIAWQEIFK